MPISVLQQHTPEKVFTAFKGLVNNFKERNNIPKNNRVKNLIQLKAHAERIQKSNSILNALKAEHADYLRKVILQLEKEIYTTP